MAAPVFVDSPNYWSAGADELLEIVWRRPSWHARAECRNHPRLNWFPTRGESTDAIKAVCAGCPVRIQCEHFGMTERHGIWGGLSERERRRERRDAA